MTDSTGAPPSGGDRRHATPWPPFDLAAFARDSELRLRAAESAPPKTLPPGVSELLIASAGRVQEVRQQLDDGTISRDDALRALRVDLATLELEAMVHHVEPLVSMVADVRAAIESLEAEERAAAGVASSRR